MKPGLFGTMVPSSWSLRSLGELVQEGSDSAIPSETPTLPYIGMEHIESGTGRVIALASPNDYRSSSYVAKPNQVLYGRLRPYLNKVFIPDREVYASREFIPLTPGESLNSHYLLYLLRSSEFVNYAMSLNSGDRPRVKWQQMESCLIPAPPSDEQNEIVRILEEQFSRLDAAAASIAAVRRKADQFRRSILHAAFSGGLTQHGACRMNPAEDQTSSIPDSWMMKTIGDVASYVRGVTYDKSLSRTSPAKGYTPLLRATNIDSGALILEDFVYVPEDIVKAEQLLKIGDLVIAASSGSSSVVGKSAPIVTDFSGTFGAFCAVLRADLAISNKYLGYYIQSHSVRELWSSLARGTNINNLKRDQVCSTPIAVPPRNEQDEIVRILEEQFSRQQAILTVADSVDRKVTALRRSLLHAAFSGELTKLWREESYG